MYEELKRPGSPSNSRQQKSTNPSSLFKKGKFHLIGEDHKESQNRMPLEKEVCKELTGSDTFLDEDALVRKAHESLSREEGGGNVDDREDYKNHLNLDFFQDVDFLDQQLGNVTKSIPQIKDYIKNRQEWSQQDREGIYDMLHLVIEYANDIDVMGSKLNIIQQKEDFDSGYEDLLDSLGEYFKVCHKIYPDEKDTKDENGLLPIPTLKNISDLEDSVDATSENVAGIVQVMHANTDVKSDSEDIENDVSLKRGLNMNQAAERLQNVEKMEGVAKIGNKHVGEIKANCPKTSYQLITKEEFNSILETWRDPTQKRRRSPSPQDISDKAPRMDF